jgi:predicted RNA polymerase sigma factor
MVRGPRAGLELLDALDTQGRIGDHRPDAVRAHLWELAGDLPAARRHYRAAADRATSVPQQRYLHARAARLPGSDEPAADA